MVSRQTARRATSLLLLALWIAACITGVALMLLPKGGRYVNPYHELKEQVALVHEVTSILCVAVSVLHVYFNWAALKSYLGFKER